MRGNFAELMNNQFAVSIVNDSTAEELKIEGE